jgi:hypothetical protein
MVDATISRVRLRDLACLGRSGVRLRAFGPPGVACASRRQAVADASGIGDVLSPRPRAASSRPGTDDLMASTIAT